MSLHSETSSEKSEPVIPPERKESLWILTIAPSIWALHFLASYITAAVWCAKSEGSGKSFEIVRSTIGIYTLVAMSLIGWMAWWGYQQVIFRSDKMPHDVGTAEDRHHFLGFATLLLAALSGIATLFVAATAVFIKTCD